VLFVCSGRSQEGIESRIVCCSIGVVWSSSRELSIGKGHVLHTTTAAPILLIIYIEKEEEEDEKYMSTSTSSRSGSMSSLA
jgi:hypothetical protein